MTAHVAVVAMWPHATFAANMRPTFACVAWIPACAGSAHHGSKPFAFLWASACMWLRLVPELLVCSSTKLSPSPLVAPLLLSMSSTLMWHNFPIFLSGPSTQTYRFNKQPCMRSLVDVCRCNGTERSTNSDIGVDSLLCVGRQANEMEMARTRRRRRRRRRAKKWKPIFLYDRKPID